MPNHDDSIIKILVVVVISFFSAFTRELNDRAKNPKESFLMFVSEVLLNGVCGAITGVLAFGLTDNIYIVFALASVGGLMGMSLLVYVTKMLLLHVAALKNISLDQINQINLEDEKKEEAKPEVKEVVGAEVINIEEIVPDKEKKQ
jgi:hypothetical protein